MAGLIDFLPVLALGIAGFATVVVVLTGLLRWFDRANRRSGDGALPSHYAGLVSADGPRSSGYCRSCRTQNDPQSRICTNCGAHLSGGESVRNGDVDADNLTESLSR